MNTNANINIKVMLDRLSCATESLADLYNDLKLCLGEDAYYIRDYADLRRLEREDDLPEQLEGELATEDLQFIWKREVDYIWHYKGYEFRITPVKGGNSKGFILYYPDSEDRSVITLKDVIEMQVEAEEWQSVWYAVEARMYGIADSYATANKDIADGYAESRKGIDYAKIRDEVFDYYKSLTPEQRREMGEFKDAYLKKVNEAKACVDRPTSTDGCPFDQTEQPSTKDSADGQEGKEDK